MPQKLHKAFTIYGKALSLNDTLRQHWAVRSKAGNDWKKKVLLAAGMNYGQIPGRVHVRFTVYRCRTIDCDNLQGGSLKKIRDCLKICGWIQDDSPSCGLFTYEQAKCVKGKERVDIEIQEQ